MSTGLLYALVFGGILLASVLFVASIYNRLVTARQRTLNAFSQIDVQLKRRHDLIPNLVESVKGYMAHERQTLEAVVVARSQAVQAASLAAANPKEAGAVLAAASAENGLIGALSRLTAIAEKYPDLKADRNVGQLMEELSSTENRVAFARQAYNDAVMVYNTTLNVFPSNMFATMFGFRDAALFQIEDATQREVVPVSFGDGSSRGATA